MKLLIRSDGFSHQVYDAETGQLVEGVQDVEIVLGRTDFAIAKISLLLPTVEIRNCYNGPDPGAQRDLYEAGRPTPPVPAPLTPEG